MSDWLRTTWRDLQYGFRQFRKTPVLVTVAVLSLALGIGANTAIFSLIDAVMLQSLPVRDPGRLVLLSDDIGTGASSGDDYPDDELSYPAYQYLKTHNDVFRSLCAFRGGIDEVAMHVQGSMGSSATEHVGVHLVSGNYFETLGVESSLGRLLQPADDLVSAAPVAVISYGYWQNRFHSDPAVLGRVIVLNGDSFSVAGVADPSFFGERIGDVPDFWLPLSVQPQVLSRDAWSNSRADWLTARNVFWLNFMGRLKPGINLQSAQAAIVQRLREFYAESSGTHLSAAVRRKIDAFQVHLKPGGAGISGVRYLYSKPLHVLMAVVALVLLIACANVAILLLARASARHQEFVTRLALGAPRARLFRQVLTESILLSMCGGVVGVGVAWWCVQVLAQAMRFDRVINVKPNPAVLAFTLVVSLLSGILFGMAPALRFSRINLRADGHSRFAFFRRSHLRSQHGLVTLQVALSLVLLIGSGLLVRSLLALELQRVGFERDHVLLLRSDASLAGYKPDALFPLYRELGERFNQLPGVVSATVSRFSPESGNTSSFTGAIEGATASSGRPLAIYDLSIGPRFFETLGMRILRGRALGEVDTPGSPPVAVVNQTFARQYLNGQDPVGRHFSLGSPFTAPGFEIVGVVEDARFYDLHDDAKPMAFFSIWQKPVTNFEVLMHTVGAPEQIADEARRALHTINSELPVLRVKTLSAQVQQTLRQQKMITSLCSVFGGLSLLLAAVGIYGTLAYSVAGRVTEIGIRMAVGAQRSSIIWLVLGDSFLLTAAGLAIGLPLALAGTRSLKSFLFGVRAMDPIAFAGAVLVIVLLASLAAFLPAQRAAAMDPLRALRHE